MTSPALGTDKFPSGSWTLGPLTIQWSLKAGNVVDIEVSVFGVDVDSLKGTLSGTTTKIQDDVSVLGIVTGSIAVEAKYNTGNNNDGLYLEGRLTGPGFDTGQLSHRIISW